jgi:hypothetical protein
MRGRALRSEYVYHSSELLSNVSNICAGMFVGKQAKIGFVSARWTYETSCDSHVSEGTNRPGWSR